MKSAPFYWIECDYPGCKQRIPDDCSDALAWAAPDQAVTDAEASEWSINHKGSKMLQPEGKDYCPDHIPNGCDCDLLEIPRSLPPCDEFAPRPTQPSFCICGHLEECHS